jgi:hypothetical protein
LAAEGSGITDSITNQWNNGPTLQLEIDLVVNKVAHAILNFGKNCNILYYWRSNHI